MIDFDLENLLHFQHLCTWILLAIPWTRNVLTQFLLYIPLSIWMTLSNLVSCLKHASVADSLYSLIALQFEADSGIVITSIIPNIKGYSEKNRWKLQKLYEDPQGSIRIEMKTVPLELPLSKTPCWKVAAPWTKRKITFSPFLEQLWKSLFGLGSTYVSFFSPLVGNWKIIVSCLRVHLERNRYV